MSIIGCNKKIENILYSGYTITKIYSCGGKLVWEAEPTPPPTPTASDYLTIIPNGDGTLKLLSATTSFQYSFNSGATWNNATSSTTITMNNGIPLWFKGNLRTTSTGIGHFSASTQFEAAGNPMSLIYGENFTGETSVPNNAFYRLFDNCSNLTSIDGIELPATTLGDSCYGNMFMNCTSLTSIPSGLLPATTLEMRCYMGMFQNCFALTTVPSDLLSAATLKPLCYTHMFDGCTSLTAAPNLPAITLMANCYNSMFKNCRQLTSITCLAMDVTATDCTEQWVSGVAANGTFTKAQGFLGWTQGVDGIPQGWTVQEA